MSKETFDRLVTQLSNEAEVERAAEERTRQRRKRLTQIANVLCWLMMAGGVAAGYYYRDEIGQATQKLTSGKQQPAEMAEVPKKMKELVKVTEKHAAEVDRSGNLDSRQTEVFGQRGNSAK